MIRSFPAVPAMVTVSGAGAAVGVGVGFLADRFPLGQSADGGNWEGGRGLTKVMIAGIGGTFGLLLCADAVAGRRFGAASIAFAAAIMGQELLPSLAGWQRGDQARAGMEDELGALTRETDDLRTQLAAVGGTPSVAPRDPADTDQPAAGTPAPQASAQSGLASRAADAEPVTLADGSIRPAGLDRVQIAGLSPGAAAARVIAAYDHDGDGSLSLEQIARSEWVREVNDQTWSAWELLQQFEEDVVSRNDLAWFFAEKVDSDEGEIRGVIDAQEAERFYRSDLTERHAPTKTLRGGDE